MGLVVYTSAFTAHRSVIYWENSGLSEISTQTLGNVNIHGFAGGVRGTPVIDVRGV